MAHISHERCAAATVGAVTAPLDPLSRRASQAIPQRNVWARRRASVVLIVAARFRLSRSALRLYEWHARLPLGKGRCTTRPSHARSHDQRRVRAIGSVRSKLLRSDTELHSVR